MPRYQNEGRKWKAEGFDRQGGLLLMCGETSGEQVWASERGDKGLMRQIGTAVLRVPSSSRTFQQALEPEQNNDME